MTAYSVPNLINFLLVFIIHTAQADYTYTYTYYTTWWFWIIWVVIFIIVATTAGCCCYKRRHPGVVVGNPSSAGASTMVVTTTGQPGPYPITGGYDNMGMKPPHAYPGSPYPMNQPPQPQYQPAYDGYAYPGGTAPPPPAYSPN